jgi:hypothetical protein
MKRVDTVVLLRAYIKKTAVYCSIAMEKKLKSMKGVYNTNNLNYLKASTVSPLMIGTNFRVLPLSYFNLYSPPEVLQERNILSDLSNGIDR